MTSCDEKDPRIDPSGGEEKRMKSTCPTETQYHPQGTHSSTLIASFSMLRMERQAHSWSHSIYFNSIHFSPAERSGMYHVNYTHTSHAATIPLYSYTQQKIGKKMENGYVSRIPRERKSETVETIAFDVVSYLYLHTPSNFQSSPRGS